MMADADPYPDVATTIFHAFDMHCNAIQLMLPQLQKEGYTHVQVSPMQKSRTTWPRSTPRKIKRDDKWPWWFQYQPVSFTVGNCYGTPDDLKSLTSAAALHGMSVLVDVCFNFMAELDVVSDNEKKDLGEDASVQRALDTAYPPFVSANFKPRKNSRGQNNWFQGRLPCLRLDTAPVQSVHFQYLQELANCGVTGFRFDCGGWFEECTAQAYQRACSSLKYPVTCPGKRIVYWELTERRNADCVARFCRDIGPALEYMHADKLARALTTNNLKELLDFDTHLECLNPDNVTFAVNHDTYHSAQSGLSVKFSGAKDSVLATCFLLSLQNGQPLVFCAQASDPDIKEAVRFRQHCGTMPSTILQCGSNVILVRRLHRGVFVLNNSTTETARLPGRLLAPKSVCFVFSNNDKMPPVGKSSTDDLFVTGAQKMFSAELSKSETKTLNLTDMTAWPPLGVKK